MVSRFLGPGRNKRQSDSRSEGGWAYIGVIEDDVLLSSGGSKTLPSDVLRGDCRIEPVLLVDSDTVPRAFLSENFWHSFPGLAFQQR
jgi:hypothetical protein